MKAPYFWNAGLDPRSREAAPLTRALLTPLSALYTWGVRRRLRTATRSSVTPYIVCVGNLTVGGVGKTPIVAALRSALQERCRENAPENTMSVATLSRGYGGTNKAPRKVDPASDTAAQVGDEPLMLAGAPGAHSYVSRNRADAIDMIYGHGHTIIVMDDGHQNPSLVHDLSVLVMDAAAPVGNGFVLPKGPLREPPREGMARADRIILMGDGDVPPAIAESGKPILRARLTPTAPPPDGPLVAFAGIGRPQKVFDALIAAGADLREGVSYSDHHAYSAGELDFLQKLAIEHGARLITTTKDHVRLPQALRQSVLTFPVIAAFDPPDALDTLVSDILTAAEAKAAKHD